jgi:glycosyltransferase involved in cell wall biosynthesis
MRVTMLVRCLAMMRGGGETRHLAWMRELIRMGVHVDVITGRPWLFGRPRHPVDDLPAMLIRSPYTRDAVYRWQHQRGFGRLTMWALHADEEWFCRAAWRRIASRSEAPDIVHAHALYQTARLRRLDVPVVINAPGQPHARYADDLRLADAVVADGWAAEHLPAMLGRPIDAVTKGVDATVFQSAGPDLRRELGLEGKRVVLSVGRLVPLKNVRLLIDAFGLVRRSQPHAHLVIVGEGPELAGLRARACEARIDDAVSFVRYVPQADTPSYYRSADVFALSSDFDNSPNVVLEAMACGRPVVATRVGGVAEFVEDGRGGLLVPKNDPRRLSEAICELLNDAGRARTQGAFNRERVERRFSWRASALQLLAVYDRVIGGRRDARIPASA